MADEEVEEHEAIDLMSKLFSKDGAIPSTSTDTNTQPKRRQKRKAEHVYVLDSDEDYDEEEGGERAPTPRRASRGRNMRMPDRSGRCVVAGCGNTNDKLLDWRETVCVEHGLLHEECACRANEPFILYLLTRGNVLMTAIYCELVLSIDQLLKLTSQKLVSKTWRVCSQHFHNSTETTKFAFPVLGLGKTHEEILVIARRYSLTKALPKNFENVNLKELNTSIPHYRLARISTVDYLKSPNRPRLPVGWKAGEEFKCMVRFLTAREEALMEGREFAGDMYFSDDDEEMEEDDEEPVVPTQKSSRPTKKKKNEPDRTAKSTVTRSNGAQLQNDKQCAAELCNSKLDLVPSRYLPDDLETCVKWIELCKSDIVLKNYFIQKCVEAKILAERNNAPAKDLMHSIAFRVCEKHFDGGPLPSKLLPKQYEPVPNMIRDFLKRRDLFYMYNIDIEVDVPSPMAQPGPKLKNSCAIPHCGVGSNMFNTFEKRTYRLFPVPMDNTLREEWDTAIHKNGTLAQTFSLYQPALVCERHFPHGGRDPDGKPELPTANIGLPLRSTYTSAPKENVSFLGPTKLCAVDGCPVTSLTTNQERGEVYKLFEIPSANRAEWVEFIKSGSMETDPKEVDGAYVCERHFERVPPEGPPTRCLTKKEAFLPGVSNTLAAVLPAVIASSSAAPPKAVNRPGPNLIPRQECCEEVARIQLVIKRMSHKAEALQLLVYRLMTSYGLDRIPPKPYSEKEDDLSLYGSAKATPGLHALSTSQLLVGLQGLKDAQMELKEGIDMACEQNGIPVDDEAEPLTGSSNDLLMQLLQNAVPGQVAGEIVDLTDEMNATTKGGGGGEETEDAAVANCKQLLSFQADAIKEEAGTEEENGESRRDTAEHERIDDTSEREVKEEKEESGERGEEKGDEIPMIKTTTE